MHPRAAASLFVGSEKFFYPRADSPIHFFAFEIPSRSSAGDSARIRSGFACREKNTVRAKSTRSFCKICKYLVSLAPRWRFGCRGCPFFCAFSPLEPRADVRPTARAATRGFVARRAPLPDARSRPASLHGASASMDSEAAILRWLEPDETGACLSRGRAGFSRPRALVVPLARPTTTFSVSI